MNAYYFELTVTPSDLPELFLDFINEIFPDPVEEREKSFILRSEDDDLQDISWAIESFAQALSENLGKPVTVRCSIEQLSNEDWIKKYQEGVEPVEVGSFYIHPSWHEAKADKNNILIDPALAFGSGHHPTTATCLKAIENHISAGQSVVDVGCGSGILGIAAAKLQAVVDLCDTDEEAILNTKENFEKNGVEFHSIWQGSINTAPQSYNVVIANIVADVLTFIASDIYKKLEDNGIVILSGILDKYEEKVLRSYKKFELVERLPQDEWVSLVMKKQV